MISTKAWTGRRHCTRSATHTIQNLMNGKFAAPLNPKLQTPTVANETSWAEVAASRKRKIQRLLARRNQCFQFRTCAISKCTVQEHMFTRLVCRFHSLAILRIPLENTKNPPLPQLFIKQARASRTPESEICTCSSKPILL